MSSKNSPSTAKGPRPLADLGAGLTTRTTGPEPHPSGPPKHGTAGQAERAFTVASTFFSGMLAINASQFLGAPLKAIDPKFYNAYMAFTKQSFGVLITTMTQWWSPTVVRVSGDKSIPGQLFAKKDGGLECRFPKRIVMMANHQLYTDWLYLWWIAYTNNLHGYIYIILKESLKNVPMIGWGAQFYNFIFLSRKWEQDKAQFEKHLDELNDSTDPMWLLIFPEGTNLAKGTRAKSKAWAEKSGVEDMKHQLLPRSKGLQVSLQRLHKSTEWLYDVTIGYEGIPPGRFGQDIFTLRSSMFEGRPPKSVNMHFRRFKISKIPWQDDVAFDVWLRNRWREKDYLLEHFTRFNRFPDDINWMSQQKQSGKKVLVSQPAKSLSTQIKSNSLQEFLSIFAPLTSVLGVLFTIYGGSNPADLMQLIGNIGDGTEALNLIHDESSKDKPLRLQKGPRTNNPMHGLTMDQIDKLTPATAQKELIQNYLKSVRPAATKQISLPPNLRASSQPGATKRVQTQKAPARAQTTVGGQPKKINASKPQATPHKPPTIERRHSLNTTVYPRSSVSQINMPVTTKQPAAQGTKPGKKTGQTAANPVPKQPKTSQEAIIAARKKKLAIKQ